MNPSTKSFLQFTIAGCCLAGVLTAGCSAPPETAALRVAVASNFQQAFGKLESEFERQTNLQVEASFGASGKFAAQIRNGGPFDVFLSADAAHPDALVHEGFADADSRLRYAVGRLALYAVNPAPPEQLLADLQAGKYEHLAIAKPELAPYGAAAKQVLEQLGLWEAAAPKLVFGENITQAYQFVRSGAAELGFVALSQVLEENDRVWPVPESHHQPIAQDAVVINSSTDKAHAAQFLKFLASPKAQAIIAEQGYSLP